MDPRRPSDRDRPSAAAAEAPLELFTDRGVYAGVLVLMLVLSGAGWMLAGEHPPLAVALGIGGCLGTLATVRAGWSRGPRITIDTRGICDTLLGPAVIPWPDLTGVEIGRDGEAYLYLRDQSRTLERFGWRSPLMALQMSRPRERRRPQQGPHGLCLRLGGLTAGRNLAAAQIEWAVETFGPPNLLWRQGLSPARAAIAGRKAAPAAKSPAGDRPPILPG